MSARGCTTASRTRSSPAKKCATSHSTTAITSRWSSTRSSTGRTASSSRQLRPASNTTARSQRKAKAAAYSRPDRPARRPAPWADSTSIGTATGPSRRPATHSAGTPNSEFPTRRCGTATAAISPGDSTSHVASVARARTRTGRSFRVSSISTVSRAREPSS